MSKPIDNTYKSHNPTKRTDEEPVKKVTIKPTLKADRRRSSALSLKSIHKKNSVKKSSSDEFLNSENLPNDLIKEGQFMELWNSYIKNLNKKGEKIIASILNTDKPKLNGSIIELTFPNSMMKAELLKIRPKLLKYFREKLNNYSLDFDIKVNEESEKKFAYTPQEKYNKLLEKNKSLAKLKKTFKLDL